MARGLAALQRWLGRAQLWLSSPWDDSGAVFTSAVLLFLVCHDTLACSGRQSPIEVPAIDSRLTGALAAALWQLTECCSC